MKTLSLIIVSTVTLFASNTTYAQRSAPVELNAPEISEVSLPEFTSTDQSRQPASWWEARVAQEVAALGSDNQETRETALRTLVFIANNYGEKANLKPAVAPLYNLYRFNKVETHRIMALSALQAIGDDESMRLLGEDLQWEISPRVRTLMKAAVASYFGG